MVSVKHLPSLLDFVLSNLDHLPGPNECFSTAPLLHVYSFTLKCGGSGCHRYTCLTRTVRLECNLCEYTDNILIVLPCSCDEIFSFAVGTLFLAIRT